MRQRRRDPGQPLVRPAVKSGPRVVGRVALDEIDLSPAARRRRRRSPIGWVARLAEAHVAGRFHAELTRLGCVALVIFDEVGYIPFEVEAANLYFQFVSAPLRTSQRHRHQQQTLRQVAEAKSSATASLTPA